MNDFKKNKLRELFTVPRIITVLYQEFPRDFIFPGESNDFWEFIYVEKGEILITADSLEYLLKAGETAFHKPNEFHTIKAMGHSDSTAVVVTFECKSPSMQFFENKILFTDENEKELLSQILKEGNAAFEKINPKPPIMGMRRKRNVPPGTEQTLKLYLELFLIHIFRRKDTITRRERYTLSPANIFDKKLTEDIKAYLGENIDKNITLGELSRHMNVSVSKIKKSFKEQTCKSVIDCFWDMKTEEAKKLISGGEYNFTSISEMVGCNSIHYFSRMFKKRTGMTPTMYKNSLKR
jgi:AraC-like DNA-binding protein